MFEQIQGKFNRILKVLKGHGKIKESNIDDTLREVRRALLEADVNYKVVQSFIERVKDKASGEKVYNSVSPGQQFIKILKDELTIFLGKKKEQISFTDKKLFVILVAGLQGSGKTTSCVKLSRFLKNDNRFPLILAADLQRPAAIKQLKVLAEREEIDVFSMETNDPIDVVSKGIEYANQNSFDTVIIDTAGRLHIDNTLMNQIKEINLVSKPDEILYVVDSMVGQDAIHAANKFNEYLNFSGIMLTKLDGDSRGGVALSLRECTSKPIKFIGTGESINQFEIFHPERMASRILGMGDIVSLVEKAERTFDEETAKSTMSRIKDGHFTFEDYLSQISQIKKMGSLSDMVSMIPGMKKMKNVSVDDKQLKWIEAIINSMNKEERKRPEIINGSRRKRIADGCGRSIQEVNRLIKQFEQMKNMVKKMGNLNKMNFPFKV